MCCSVIHVWYVSRRDCMLWSFVRFTFLLKTFWVGRQYQWPCRTAMVYISLDKLFSRRYTVIVMFAVINCINGISVESMSSMLGQSHRSRRLSCCSRTAEETLFGMCWDGFSSSWVLSVGGWANRIKAWEKQASDVQLKPMLQSSRCFPEQPMGILRSRLWLV